MGSLLGRLRKIKAYTRDYLPKARFVQRLLVFFDSLWTCKYYGCSIDDYFRYQFFYRRHSSRKDFIVWRQRKRIINTCNKTEDRDIFISKPRFNKLFDSFLGRDWLDVEACCYEDFAAFVARNKRFFVKPVAGSFGWGVRIHEVGDTGDLQELLHSLQEEKVLVEEIVEQLPEMAEFNPTSVNTMRLVTLLCHDNEVKVMTATMRCGNGDKCADNFHHNGIASTIDIPTGIVTTTGVDMESRRYVIHPVSKKPIIGFKIPFWDKIIATVTAAAKVVPTIRYVGWDVALSRDGRVVVIEGNYAADPDVTQMPDQVGKWPLYEEELKNIAGLHSGKQKRRRRDSVDKDAHKVFQEGNKTIAG